jgi:primary-amine oxidase
VVPGGGALSVLDPDDDAQARGAFSAHRVWLTARKAEERYPAGDFPNLSPGGGGLPAYAADGDPVVGADLALWVTVGFRHLTRAEDWPIMPTRWYGFLIRPYNFFDESPAYDVPPEFAD